MAWYYMTNECEDINTPCKECKKPIKLDDKYMLFGHKPPFEFAHAACIWEKYEKENTNGLQ